MLAGAKSQEAKLRFADPDMPVAMRMPAKREKVPSSFPAELALNQICVLLNMDSRSAATVALVCHMSLEFEEVIQKHVD